MNIVVVGYGAMGERLVNQIGQTEGLSLVGVVDSLQNFGLASFDELTITPDVIVDFSHPSNLKGMLDYAVNNQVALVIATTGYSVDDEVEIKAASKLIPIVKTTNTSLGISVLQEVLRKITPALDGFDIEVVEKHHNQKLDSPSGTAKTLLETITKTRDTLKLIHGREGNARRDGNEIGVHAIRGGTISGEHSVIFAGLDEIIEIKHTALSKNVFVTGALKAVNYIYNKKVGLYSMKEVLFREE